MDRGTIALDIDGTITRSDHLIPDGVAHYFNTLHKEGWQFIFVTGRFLSFALMSLNKLDFPFLLVLQNGADLLEMPQKKRVHRSYLTLDVVLEVDALISGEENDFVLYSGYEKGDRGYFRASRFTPEMLAYLKDLEKLSPEPWRAVDSFERCGQSTFPLIKCIGSKERLELLNKKLKALKGIITTIILDPISQEFYLILITHEDADKGKAVKKLFDLYQLKRPLITGGNDNNDLPLLKEGDLRIAMDGSPDPLLDLADIVAPPADQMGIIDGVQEAIRRLL
ncbi:MAG: hypothetical protein K1060chlam2_00875 [Chlamydiae bacterium]|nr:hypothetical protein [Chlamydiota bacterium]